MEDQDKRTEEQEDVEAHRRRHAAQASEEPSDEAEGDDVEAHRGKRKAMASEDAPAAEGEGEDEDFELHRKSPRAL